MRTCDHCGGPVRRRYGARFCSAVCRQRAYRRRKWGAAEDLPQQQPSGSNSTIVKADLKRGGPTSRPERDGKRSPRVTRRIHSVTAAGGAGKRNAAGRRKAAKR